MPKNQIHFYKCDLRISPDCKEETTDRYMEPNWFELRGSGITSDNAIACEVCGHMLHFVLDLLKVRHGFVCNKPNQEKANNAGLHQLLGMGYIQLELSGKSESHLIIQKCDCYTFAYDNAMEKGKWYKKIAGKKMLEETGAKSGL